MERNARIKLIERLVMAHSPSGNEREIDPMVQAEFERFGHKVWQDAAGNIICYVEGARAEDVVAVTGHKDEIGMIVKRIGVDGRLRVREVGGAYAWRYGEGVVDVLGDEEVVSGILSVGASHTSEETLNVALARTEKPLTWDLVYVETKLDPVRLAERGVHIGSKVVVGRHWKRPFVLEDFICGYGLDGKVGVAVLIGLAGRLAEKRPPQDVYLVASAAEEIGVFGASYAARKLDVERLIALEVGPVADEYQTVNDARPLLFYQDARGLYDEEMNRELAEVAKKLNIGVQRICVASFGSDASYVRSYGLVPRTTCLGYPTENTHGYEIMSLQGIEHVERLVEGYLQKSPNDKAQMTNGGDR